MYLTEPDQMAGIFDFLKKKDDDHEDSAPAPSVDKFKWPGGKSGEKDAVYGILYGTHMDQAQPIIDAYNARQVAAAAGFSSVNEYNAAMKAAADYGAFGSAVGRAGAAGWIETLAVLGGVALVGYVILKKRRK